MPTATDDGVAIHYEVAGPDDAEPETVASVGKPALHVDARVVDDGYYHIEGRKKNMFVSGGENVYPPAVEDAIAEHPDVGDVVVIGIPDDTWGTVGRAVVEPASGVEAEPLDLEELEDFLADTLARFEVPKALAFVDELPTSSPSKIDRQAVEEAFGE